MGEPPYDFVIRSADRMVASFGYSGIVAYCDRMLEARGGRGLDSIESIEQRRYFEEARAAALREEGDTLLDWILAVFEGAPARITSAAAYNLRILHRRRGGGGGGGEGS